MWQLGETWRQQQATYPYPQNEGNFVDNHDNSRFLNNSARTIPLYQSALAHTLFMTGIPIVYYGTEQSFSGGIDGNYCREPLWISNYRAPTVMGTFLTIVNGIHEDQQLWNYPMVQELWRDDTVYCYSRGPSLLVCTTNTVVTQSRSIPNLPFKAGTTVCDALSSSTCFVMPSGGQATVTIPAGGFPILMVPSP